MNDTEFLEEKIFWCSECDWEGEFPDEYSSDIWDRVLYLCPICGAYVGD